MEIRGSELAREGCITGDIFLRLKYCLRKQACSHRGLSLTRKIEINAGSVGANLFASAVCQVQRLANKLAPT